MIKLDKEFKLQHGTLIYLLSLIGILIGQIVCYIIFTAAANLSENAQEALSTALNLIFQFSNITIFCVFIFRSKAKPKYFVKTNVSPLSYIAGAVFGIICLIGFIPLSTTGQIFLKHIGYQLQDNYVSGILAQDIFLVLISVVFAPVCEELIYRSALLSGLKQRFNDIITSLLVALAFSLMHMNPEQTVYQFCLGFGASMLVLSTGSVIPSMIMHAVSNLIVTMGMVGVSGFTHFFNWYEGAMSGNTAVVTVSAFLIAAAGISTFILGSKLLKILEKERADKKHKNQEYKEVEVVSKQQAQAPLGIKESFFVKNRAILFYVFGLAVSIFMWMSIFIAKI